MPLFTYIKINGNVYVNRPDIPRLGETLREMVDGLRSNGGNKKSAPLEMKRLSPAKIVEGKEILEGLKAKYPLKRDKLGRLMKPL